MVEWRPVAGWEDRYEVSCQGEVVAIARTYKAGAVIGTRPRRSLLQTPSGRDQTYRRVMLCRGKVKRKHMVHHVVAETFHGPRPEGYVCCHKNDISDDNRAVNLYWGTEEDNRCDRHINGLDLDSMEPAPF